MKVKIVEDIKVYELNEFTLEMEIPKGLESAMQYGKKYRDVHIELKMGLESYPEYEKVVGNLREQEGRRKVGENIRKGRKENYSGM